MASTKVPIELSSTPGIVDNSNATAITIDSSENVGIGTITPAYKLDVTASGSAGLRLNGTGTGGSWMAFSTSGTVYGYIASAYHVFSGGSVSDFGIRGENNLVFGTSGTEHMRINSSGNVGIGTTSPQDLLHIKKSDASTTDTTGLKITNNNITTNSIAGILFENYDSNNAWIRSLRSPSTEGTLIFGTNPGTGVAESNIQERMRIDSSGRLLVGTTSANGTVTIGGTQIPNQPALYIKAYPTNHPTSYIYRDNTDAQYCLKLRHDGPVSGSGLGYMAVFTDRNDTTVGSITVSGSTTAYNTSSDARLKEVTGSARGLEVINALNPVSYNWKKSGQADEGLLAQEVLEIVPNAVSGSEEEYYQMDYSKLVTHLVAGMKEQQVLIEQLQAEVALLKGE